VDDFVEVNVKREDRKFWVPNLVVAVFCIDYQKTLAKLTHLLIDQLRLLRHVNTNISKCLGFVFPRQREHSFVPEIIVDK